ncbi:MAG: mannose-1-phosphate guanylyltransferase [Deltaproteobacteria bacterium]|nr:mannose-1-phosphate guanylyltransferase [Deltaproteobacteria bacterium]
MTRSQTAVPYAVIMAGGSGTRFWPRSRTDRPKQVLNITGDEILLKKVVELIKPIIPPQTIKIVTTRSQVEGLRQIVPEIAARDIIAEPFGKNTAPAIGISALYVERDHPEGLMIVLPADHYIEDHEVFRRTIRIAVDKASQEGCIVTIGIAPRGPDTGYGYIEAGEVMDKKGAVYAVKSFHEKPDQARAKDFIEKGNYFWNSGMFIAKASVMLGEIEEHLPRNHELLMDIRASLGTDDEQTAIEEAYGKMEAISIDYGVIEKSRNIVMVEGGFGWDDVGSWPSAAQYWPRDSQENAHIGELINIDSSRCIVHSPIKPVALLGVEDLIIVEEDDVLLVCRRERSQDVRRLVELLRARGRDDML